MYISGDGVYYGVIHWDNYVLGAIMEIVPENPRAIPLGQPCKCIKRNYWVRIASHQIFFSFRVFGS